MYEITPDGFWVCLLVFSVGMSLYNAVNGEYKALLYFLAGFGCLGLFVFGMKHDIGILGIMFLPGLILLLLGMLSCDS